MSTNKSVYALAQRKNNPFSEIYNRAVELKEDRRKYKRSRLTTLAKAVKIGETLEKLVKEHNNPEDYRGLNTATGRRLLDAFVGPALFDIRGNNGYGGRKLSPGQKRKTEAHAKRLARACYTVMGKPENRDNFSFSYPASVEWTSPTPSKLYSQKVMFEAT